MKSRAFVMGSWINILQMAAYAFKEQFRRGCFFSSVRYNEGRYLPRTEPYRCGKGMYAFGYSRGVFNMAQTTFSVRMEEGLKRQFEGLCQEFGMNMATAIHVFVRAVVRERRIPFEISSLETELTREGAMQAFMTLRQEAKRSGAVDMTLEEINREIEMARQGAGK